MILGFNFLNFVFPSTLCFGKEYAVFNQNFTGNDIMICYLRFKDVNLIIFPLFTSLFRCLSDKDNQNQNMLPEDLNLNTLSNHDTFMHLNEARGDSLLPLSFNFNLDLDPHLVIDESDFFTSASISTNNKLTSNSNHNSSANLPMTSRDFSSPASTSISRDKKRNDRDFHTKERSQDSVIDTTSRNWSRYRENMQSSSSTSINNATYSNSNQNSKS